MVLLSLVGMLLAGAAFAYFDQARPHGTPGVLSLQLAFSKRTFHAIVEQWGASGLRAYRQATVLIDYWFPIAYALFLSGLIARLGSQPGHPLEEHSLLLFSLPYAAALLDWVENTVHLVMLYDRNRQSAFLVLLASLAAAAKWALISSSSGAIILLLAKRMHSKQ